MALSAQCHYVFDEMNTINNFPDYYCSMQYVSCIQEQVHQKNQDKSGDQFCKGNIQ